MTADLPLAIVPGQEYGRADSKIPGGAIVEGGDVMGRDYTDAWAEAIDGWSTSLKVSKSPTTIRQRRWQLRKLVEAHQHRSPWKLKLEDLEEWLGSHDWNAETRKSARSAVRSFYAWAVKTGRTKRNPAAELDAIPVPQRYPRPAPDVVWEQVMAAGPNDRLRLMLILAGNCGLRVGEIARLRWDDIDGDWIIVRGKGSKERRVPLVPSVAAELADEYSRRVKGRVGSGFRDTAGDIVTWVFPGKRGGMNPTWVSQLLSEALGPGATAHQLRHRAATRAMNGTGNLAAVQDLLGHASPLTTRIYARPDDAALRKAAEAI